MLRAVEGVAVCGGRCCTPVLYSFWACPVRRSRSSACKIRPDCRPPSLTWAWAIDASARIGSRRVPLWSALVVSNHGPGLFVPNCRHGQVASRLTHLTWQAVTARDGPICVAVAVLGCCTGGSWSAEVRIGLRSSRGLPVKAFHPAQCAPCGASRPRGEASGHSEGCQAGPAGHASGQ
jgi:hypothetical protein